ncbi:MAG TPA: TetR/AcrR family transcriptional regulator [Rhodanobacteraceae bacterium]
MPKPSHAPRQARSRESERRLIKATIELLGQGGLEGVSIPEVAERAGLTPGAVYRRFSDKNALMERVVLDLLGTQLQHLQQSLTPEVASQNTLQALVESLVRWLLASFRANATLVNAIRQFARNSNHAAFKRRVAELETRTLQHLGAVLMTKHEHILHPEPEPALRLAIYTLSTTPLRLFLDKGYTNHAQLFPDDHDWLVRELTRMFLGYIGAD